ncbi:hypothetical protein V502_02331 [Pseudogymnoascus sp. VKM F-4520 (FW-2644)]|nr:hypothetical protein V502_02331 [Pseudogymnoascus sp. VKM F-4520 (FW-2644)]
MQTQSPGSHSSRREIREELAGASWGFFECGDQSSQALAHALMFLLGEIDNNEHRTSVQRVGKWGGGNGAEVFTQSLGILALRYEAYYRYRCGLLVGQGIEAALIISTHLSRTSESSMMLWISAMIAHVKSTLLFGSSFATVALTRLFHELPQFVLELNKAADTVECSKLVFSSILQHYLGDIMDLVFQVSLLNTDQGISDTAAKWVQTIKEYSIAIQEDNIVLDGSVELWHERVDILRLYFHFWGRYRSDVLANDIEGASRTLFESMESQYISFRQRPWLDNFKSLFLSRLGRFEEAQASLARLEKEGIETGPSDPPRLPFLQDVPWCQAYLRFQAAERMFKTCILAREWKRAAYLKDLLENLAPGYFTSVSCVSDNLFWQRCLWAGLVEESRGHYVLALDYFLRSTELALQYRRLHLLDLNEKGGFWGNPDICRALNSVARVLIQANERGDTVTVDPSGPEPRRKSLTELLRVHCPPEAYLTLALYILDAGKALSAWDLIGTNNENQDDRTNWAESHHLWTILLQLKTLSRQRTQQEEQELRDVEAQINELRLGDKPGPPSSLEIPHPTPLSLSIPSNCLVLYTSVSEDGLAVLCVDSSGPLHAVYKPIASAIFIEQIVSLFIQSMEREKLEADQRKLKSLAFWLSQLLLKPFEDILRQSAKEQIIFVPSGPLARFPFGALILDERWLIATKVVTQVPSLKIWHHLITRSHDTKEVKLSVIAKPGSMHEQMSIGGEEQLPMAGIEALFIADLFRTEALKAKSMTKGRFKTELQSKNIIHICTHGYVDPESPLHSNISLAERIRVLDMTSLRTHALFVVFSACQSGSGRSTSNDDLLGFPHALLAVGANLFLGALWSSNDLTTLIHMWLFYSEIFRSGSGQSFARSWQIAVRHLMASTLEDVRKILDHFLCIWDKWEMDGKAPNSFVVNGRAKIEEVINSLTTENGDPLVDLTHPFSWAPFILVGNGNLAISKSII